MDPKAYRLPPHVRPLAYAVDLRTHPARLDFEGTVAARLRVVSPTRVVELHARDLEVQDARVTLGAEGGGPALAATTALDPARETVRFEFDRELPVGELELSARFRGRPNPSMHGLYLARDGAERAVCTQCEATDARGIFPCFDEPELKATITWTIRTEGDVIALANTPLRAVEAEGSEKVWRFETSAPIASYLYALVVGDFEGTAPTLVAGIPSRVWSMRGKVEQCRFAHDFTVRLLPWYEEYFDAAYPFLKYDQVAVPGFDAGAMENVGLVLFRQNLLLMDPRAASWNQEKLIAKVIAHELAHMWFGNLVTMRWWDDLWLNEAFAEWFAHKATHAAEPSYLVWNDFQADKNRALVDDALPTTHPIWTAVKTPAEALEMFDVITYQKGCAVMRMLEHFLGEAPFRAGLRTYMKEFRFANAAGPDLWRHLGEASGLPVGELMQSWVAQAGFPLIDVRLEPGDATAPMRLALSQRRFYSSPAAAAAPGEQLWSVPMVVRFEDDAGIHEHRFIFAARDAAVTLPAQGGVRWCAANADEIGFYRVNAVGFAREALLAHGPRVLTAVEQMGFIEDQWALVRNATSTIERFLPVLEAFASTRDHNVLRAVMDRLGTIDLLLEDSGDERARAGLQAWIRATFRAQLEEVGFEPRPGEPQNEVQRRALVIHAMASLGRDADAIAACERYAAAEQADPRAVDANLAGTFLAVAAKFGGAARYSTWLATYRARKDAGAPPQDCLRYLYTLAGFRPAELTAQTLNQLEVGAIPQESVGAVLSQLLGARHAQGLAWAHLKAHWASIETRVGDMGVSRVVESVGSLTAADRADIVAFFEAHRPKGAARALARALEGLDQREELRARVTPGLLARFGG